jgi:hypothetical protein
MKHEAELFLIGKRLSLRIHGEEHGAALEVLSEVLQGRRETDDLYSIFPQIGGDDDDACAAFCEAVKEYLRVRG